jgi:hypothetical protein
MAGITESEPADGEFAPAARTQIVVPSAGADTCDWIWPHRAPPGGRVTADSVAYTPMGIGNGRAVIIPAYAASQQAGNRAAQTRDPSA